MVPVSSKLQRISIIKHVLFPESLLKNDLESPSRISVCFECIFSPHTNIRDKMCSGGTCYLFWKVLDCGTEKQSHWHYMLSELGHECWWRRLKKKNISTHTYGESCNKPWGGLAWFPTAIVKQDHLLAFRPQPKSIHCRRTCLFFLWWNCFYKTRFTITVCPGIRLNAKPWAGRHNSS